MYEERDKLIKNGTWMVTDLPAGKKALDTKWVFRLKRDSTGKTQRYKARLVVRGCSQIEGIDYNETYSPVVRYTSIRFLCALAAKYDLEMDQMDVTAAYLHGYVEEELYIKPPQGIAKSDENGKVYKLIKSIYGLKQSGRAWNKRLHEKLSKLDYQRSKADPCVYFKRYDEVSIIIAVYVDDLFILSNDAKQKQVLKDELSREFEMKDLGEARYLLGLIITRDRKNGKVWLDQSTYIKNMLQKFGMEDCKPVVTPCEPSHKLSKEMGPKTDEEIREMNKIPYKEAVGCLLYASQSHIAQTLFE